jgi:rhodanese-related sulfurtransferase
MSATQILIYVLIALIVLSTVRKAINKRKVKHYNAEETNAKLKTRSILLLDVRTDAERKARNIKGSIHIPLNQLNRRAEELKKYKDKEIVCYCRSGNRSLNAALILQKQGFNVANLSGGISHWNY